MKKNGKDYHDDCSAKSGAVRLVDVTKYALLLVFLFFCSGSAFGQSVDSEPAAIIEIGAAAGQSLTGDGANGGLDVAGEVTPIENWLEIEAGVAPLFGHRSTEWDMDILFKKPWTISDKVEFMAGVGPEWTHVRERGMTTNSLGIEVAADFMFWPSGRHHFGWFLEPVYDYSFARGHEQSIGISGGLLIGLGRRR